MKGLAALRSTRVRIALVVAAAAAAFGLLAVSNLGDSLIYFRTPTEVAAGTSPTDERIRLGGLVQDGSVSTSGTNVRFVLTDGASDISVLHHGDPPSLFQAGRGVVVEGALDKRGVFVSDLLIVRHDNEYRNSEDEPYQQPADIDRSSEAESP